jgi:hypothetical protein
MLRARHRRRWLAVTVVGAILATTTGLPGAARAEAMGRWFVDDLGSPVPEPGQIQIVGAVTAQRYPEGYTAPYMYNIIDGSLYVSRWIGANFAWSALGAPPNSRIAAPVGVTAARRLPSDPQIPHAFVRTDDGHLWVNTWTGASGTWSDLGTPPTARVANAIGSVAIQDGWGAPQRPYTFVIGDDGHLWLNWWTGSRFTWDDRGALPGTGWTTRVKVGVAVLRTTAGSPDFPQAFLMDAQGQVWRHGWHGSGWSWTNHGAPPGTGYKRGVGAVPIEDGDPTAFVRPQAFASVNGLVYRLTPANGQWGWQGIAGPGGIAPNPSGLIGVRDAPDLPERPYLFSIDMEGGPVRFDWWDTAQWRHEQIPGAEGSAQGSWASGDAVAVRDTPGSPEHPCVFYWSPWSPTEPFHLMVASWR